MSKRLYPSVFKEFRLIASSVLLLVLLFSYNTSRAQLIVETFEGGSWGGLAATSGATIKSSYTNAVASSTTAANQTITSWNGGAAASTTTIINSDPIASSYVWGYFSASTVSSTAASFSWARQLRSATHAITLASNAGYLITPVVAGGITTVTFWMSDGSGGNTGVYVGLNTNTSNSTAYPTYAIGNSGTTSQVGGVYTQFPVQTSFFSTNGAYPGSASSFQYTVSGTNSTAPGQIVLFADASNSTTNYPIIDDITVYSAQPFTGTAQAIPGTIKPQNYDLGGQNYSYYNNGTTTNAGGQYRLGEGVGIENTTGDGINPYDVSYTSGGEWLDYTVNVATTGTYTLGARVATGSGSTQTFDVRIDGTSVVGGSLTCPNTGGWQTWQTVTATTSSISAGLHKLRVYFTAGNMNLNYITLTGNSISTSAISGSPFCAGASVSVPYTIAGTYNSGNIFTAQLSNASGSFSSPTSIGTLTSTSAGTISATIPTSTASGTGYLVRVIGSNPATTGSNSSSTLTINAQPTPSFTASPSSSICAGSSATYTTQSGQSSYTWSVPGTAGTDYTITSGGIGTTNNTVTLTWMTTGSKTVTVNYNNASGCTAATAASSTTTVNALPTIGGTLTVCAGLTTSLTGTGTAASSSPWVSATTSVATISNSGIVTGVSGGTSVITYTNSNGCTATATVTVNALPTISGTLNVCAGSTTALSGTGTAASTSPWVSATTSVATVSSSGVVTGVSSGTSVITYTNSNGCTATATVTVNALPTIGGTLTVCAGSTTTLTGTGTAASTSPWVSATTSVATVNSSGVVTGVSGGTSVITYTNSNGCTTTATVTVNPIPTISSQPSPNSSTYYLNGSATPLSVTAGTTIGILTYQWWSNATASTTGATEITGATSSTYIPLTTTAGTLYYYVVISNGSCSIYSGFSGAITISGLSSAWLTTGNTGTNASNFIGTTDNTSFRIRTNNIQRAIVDSLGRVGIGTDTIPTGYTFAVAGWGIFTKVNVQLQSNWPDYVFDDKYPLLPIADLEKYINTNKHLPDMLSADEIKKQGIDLGNNQTALLKKVEELTLYIIDQDKKNVDQDKEIEELQNQNKQLQDQNKLMQSEIDELKQLVEKSK